MSIIKKKEISELVGGDMNSAGGDHNPTNDSEIETGPVKKAYNDKSDYEKGQSTNTDRVFGRYVQNIPWFAVYSYGGARTGGVNAFENRTILKKKNVEERIDDLVKKSKSSDVTDKNYNPKVANIIDTITDADLTDKQIEDLEKAIMDKKTKKEDKKTL